MRDAARGGRCRATGLLLSTALSATLACSILPDRVFLEITSGDASAFSRTRRVCVHAFDTGSPADVAGAIRGELERRVGPIAPCGTATGEDEIVVQYASGPAACVDCEGIDRSPRFASAHVQVRDDAAILATGDWIWTKGGDAVEVARSFGRALADRMRASGGRRGSPEPPPSAP